MFEGDRAEPLLIDCCIKNKRDEVGLRWLFPEGGRWRSRRQGSRRHHCVCICRCRRCRGGEKANRRRSRHCGRSSKKSSTKVAGDAICPNEDVKVWLSLIPGHEGNGGAYIIPLNISNRRCDEVVCTRIIQSPPIDLDIAGHCEVKFTCRIKEVEESVVLVIVDCRSHAGTLAEVRQSFIFYRKRGCSGGLKRYWVEPSGSTLELLLGILHGPKSLGLQSLPILCQIGVERTLGNNLTPV